MKARTIGPILLIAIGVLALFAPGSDSVGVGGNPDPCEGQLGAVICETTTTKPPETTTTTTAPVTTTTAATTTTEADETTTTTAGETTTTVEVISSSIPVTEPETTQAPPVDQAEPPTTSGVAGTVVTAPAVSGTLARTGSNGIAPTTVAGALLILLGAVLLVAGRLRSGRHEA